MEWTDDGIVLGTRRHGEANAIAELLTRDHGRHLGLVRGGAGPRMRPVLQVGNSIRLVWRARLEDHLGYFTAEALSLRTAMLLSARAYLFGVTHLTGLCRLLPERDPHPGLYDHLLAIFDGPQLPGLFAAGIARFELRLLAELGFGLDLGRCAATGRTTDLMYVSPKSGCAICRQAGAPWHDRLLPLPLFLQQPDGESAPPSTDELLKGFTLTGFFLSRYLFALRGDELPQARSAFLATLRQPTSSPGVRDTSVRG